MEKSDILDIQNNMRKKWELAETFTTLYRETENLKINETVNNRYETRHVTAQVPSQENKSLVKHPRQTSLRSEKQKTTQSPETRTHTQVAR